VLHGLRLVHVLVLLGLVLVVVGVAALFFSVFLLEESPICLAV
jgi:hypothetical protein